jgi:hypothetical protein
LNPGARLRFLAQQPLSLFLGQRLRFQNHDELFEGPGKAVWHLVQVVLNDRGAGVFSDVERLIEREVDRDRPGDLTLRNLIPVDERSPGSDLAYSAAVVPEGDHGITSKPELRNQSQRVRSGCVCGLRRLSGMPLGRARSFTYLRLWNASRTTNTAVEYDWTASR